jgi:hypothetical protein
MPDARELIEYAQLVPSTYENNVSWDGPTAPAAGLE